MPEDKLLIYEAESLKNGIIFYSNRHKGYIAIATINEENIVTTQWITKKQYIKNKSKQQKKEEIKQSVLSALYDLPIFFILCILVIYGFYSNFILRFSFLGLFLLDLWIFIVHFIRKKNTGVYKFHSAEHMICDAYEDLQRIPCLEELYQYSRFSNFCGTNDVAMSLFLSATIFICTFIPHPSLRLIINLLLIIIICKLSTNGYLNFFQYFTTIPATDRELNVAIEGLKEWLKNEKQEQY